MPVPTPPKKKRKFLSCAVFSCLGCLGCMALGAIVLVVVLVIADAGIDHSEKLISSSTDYAAFTDKSKITFGPNVVSCEWVLKGRDNRKLLSLSALVPSPSDYDVIISGFVVLAEEEAQNTLAGYDWTPVSPDNDTPDASLHDEYLREKQAYMIDIMGLKDRTLLYSKYYDGKIQQQGTPYDVMTLFDAAHSTIFFHMTHL